ncbi:MAG TPA: acid phosphatase [Pseudomonadales bacterium]|nr:acid phosphatase [Pseudomonadales bacterium]
MKLTATLVLSLVSAAAAANGDSIRDPVMHGVVVGDGYYQNAKVCFDANANARCDPGERSTRTDSRGRFVLSGGGQIVAEIDTDSTLRDPVSGAAARVKDALTFRAPVRANGVVSPISTELLALRKERGNDESALSNLADRLGVDKDEVLADPFEVGAPAHDLLLTEDQQLLDRIASAVDESGKHGDLVTALRNRLALDDIENVVVIYAENRSFNNLFGLYPGANGLRNAMRHFVAQKDRDGSTLQTLPPAWGGLTAPGQTVTVTQTDTTNVLPNAPFQVDDPAAPYFATTPKSVVTRDLYHRFFENQMQIGNGDNSGFVAWADSGGLVMGYYDGSDTKLWKVAKRFTLADNFFIGSFGGSFLNHQYLICACAPEYPNADTAPAKPPITVLDTDASGNYLPRLTLKSTSPASALDGIPIFVTSSNVAPKNYFGDGTFRAVNTMGPPYQPSFNAPAADDATHLYANPLAANTLPPQTQTHIGDLLTAKGVSWAWYAGAWNQALASTTAPTYSQPPANNASNPPPVVPTFQFHHQPFNYYAEFDPVTHAADRAAHLKDYTDLVAAAQAGTLPAVAFYKPQGNLNEHAGYANVSDGDAHISDLIDQLRASPQWRHMLVIVTWDENGGWWDHVAPPKGDLLGPGTRIPALIVSPFAKNGFVDHTQYDTASILRFITHRYSLPVLDGLNRRDQALAAHGEKVMGDFTNALDFDQ